MVDARWLGPSTVLGAVGGALVVTIVTIAGQAYKAARMNPVGALQTD